MSKTERKYKEWLDKCSNRHNPDFDGREKYSLTWVQIGEIIDEHETQAKLKEYEFIEKIGEEAFNKHKLPHKIEAYREIWRKIFERFEELKRGGVGGE